MKPVLFTNTNEYLLYVVHNSVQISDIISETPATRLMMGQVLSTMIPRNTRVYSYYCPASESGETPNFSPIFSPILSRAYDEKLIITISDTDSD